MLSHSKESFCSSAKGEQVAKRNRAGIGWCKRKRGEYPVQSACGIPVNNKCKNRGEEITNTHWEVKMCTDTRETPRQKNGAGWTSSIFMPGLIKDQWCSDTFSTAPKRAGVSVACNWRSPQWLCTVCVARLPCSNKKDSEVVVPKPPRPDVGGQPTSCTSRNRKCVKRSLLPPPWLSYVLWFESNKAVSLYR